MNLSIQTSYGEINNYNFVVRSVHKDQLQEHGLLWYLNHRSVELGICSNRENVPKGHRKVFTWGFVSNKTKPPGISSLFKYLLMTFSKLFCVCIFIFIHCLLYYMVLLHFISTTSTLCHVISTFSTLICIHVFLVYLWQHSSIFTF